MLLPLPKCVPVNQSMTFWCVLMEQMTSEGSIIKHAKAVKTRMGWSLHECRGSSCSYIKVSTGCWDALEKLWSEEPFPGGAASSVSDLLASVHVGPGLLHHHISALCSQLISTPAQLLLSRTFLICYHSCIMQKTQRWNPKLNYQNEMENSYFVQSD